MVLPDPPAEVAPPTEEWPPMVLESTALTPPPPPVPVPLFDFPPVARVPTPLPPPVVVPVSPLLVTVVLEQARLTRVATEQPIN